MLEKLFYNIGLYGTFILALFGLTVILIAFVFSIVGVKKHENKST